MNKTQKAILLAILLASFILRITRLDYPMSGTFAWGDGTRDYLVANHIVRYGELPLTGPYNLLSDYGSGVKNSPFYFYILALPLLVYNHPLTLGFVNIFLQMSVLVLIFLIAKQAFNTSTALIALALFSFNPEIIKQSDYIWQPYLMMPVALLAVYLFIRGYLVLSMIAVSSSFAIHNSAFPWLAVLFVASIITKFRLGLLFALFIPLVILYMPVILTNGEIKQFPAQNISGFIHNLNLNLASILNSFGVNKLFLAVVLIISTLYRSNKNLIFGIILFLSPILFASVFHKIRFHYLILSSPVFVILLANLLDRIKFRVPKFLLLIFLFWVFSGHLQFIRDFKRPLENQHYVDEISKKIVSELPNPQTFQVKSYAKDNTTFYYPTLDTILLVPLEERLKVKLTRISDDSPFNHVQINERNYIVLACYKFHNQDSDCREGFLKDNESYEIKKTIHTSEFISIYLTKQKEY